MDRPLQALLVAGDDGLRALLSGEKRITIRYRHRAYTEGPVMLGCHEIGWAVLADITSVRHTILRDLRQRELADDGFASVADALEGLHKFYPDITMDSPVTVIRFDNLRGFMVDMVGKVEDDLAAPAARERERQEITAADVGTIDNIFGTYVEDDILNGTGEH